MSSHTVDDATKAYNPALYIAKVVIFFGLMFGVGLLPPFGQITELGMDILGIFFALIFGWMVLELGWVSIIGLIAIGLTDYASVTEAFTSGFGYYLIPTLFGSFMFAGVLEQTGLTNYLAHWFLTRKIIIGRPYLLFLMILISVEVVGTFAGGYAGCFIIWSLFLHIIDITKYSRKDPFVPFFICAILFVAMISSVILPFKAGGVMYIGFFKTATGLGMNDVAFLILNLIIVNVFILALLAVLKFVYKPDLTRIANAGDLFVDLRVGKMNAEQRNGLIVLSFFIFVLLIPSFIAQSTPLVQFINNLGVLGMSFIVIIIFSIMRRSDGSSYINLQKLHNSISWDVVWLIIATLPLANAMEADSTGIMATFMDAVLPSLSSVSPIIFILIVFVFIALATQVVHNLLLVIIFIPIACPLAIQLGGNPYLVFFLIYWASNLAYLTPAASMTAALMHGHPDVSPKNAYTCGLIFLLLGLILIPLIVIPYCSMLF